MEKINNNNENSALENTKSKHQFILNSRPLKLPLHFNRLLLKQTSYGPQYTTDFIIVRFIKNSTG